MAERTGVLFVCLGNICRSPLAEGIFLDRAAQRGVLGRFDVDSCGTGAWHAGERADPRVLEVARRHRIELPSIARVLDPPLDFARFDWLIAMDRSNARHLLRAGAAGAQVRLMRSFDPAVASGGGAAPDVPDPYGGSEDGFESVFRMLDAACAGLLEFLLAPA